MGEAAQNSRGNASRAKREQVWIRRLRNMPPGVFDPLVRRIVKGDPLRHIAQYLHGIKPDLSEETFRKWLQVLAKQVKAELELNKNVDQVQKAIEDFNAAKADGQFADVESPAANVSTRVSKRLKAAVARAIKDLDSENMLKYVWVLELERFEAMREVEKSTGILFPQGDKHVSALTKIAVATMEHEMGIALMKQKGGGVPKVKELFEIPRPKTADAPDKPFSAQDFFDAIRGNGRSEDEGTEDDE